MRAALSRSGIDITPATVSDLVRFLASGSKLSVAGRHTPQTNQDDGRNLRGDSGKAPSTTAGSGVVDEMYITFQEFRDFLIMLPRKATPLEIYKCRSLMSDLWNRLTR